MVKIRDEYWVELKGRKHATYPGVLVALHESGLLGIEVTVLQYPTAENGNTAVCQATVTMRGDDGRELLFQEIGDASPANVGHHIAPHIIRMAATRAKGRAGRDALALGIALAEEFGPDAEEAPRTQQEPRREPPRARHDPQDQATRRPAAGAPDPAFQTAYLTERAERQGITCTADGCGALLSPKEIEGNRRRWPGLGEVCLVHATERRLEEKEAAAAMEMADPVEEELPVP